MTSVARLYLADARTLPIGLEPPTEKYLPNMIPSPPDALEWPVSRFWRLSHRYDRKALPLANRHYNRQKPDSPQFCPPGKIVALLSVEHPVSALWVSNYQDHVSHRWPGAWTNSLFRNEGENLSSELIRDALAVTRFYWREVPELGLITFIDSEKVKKKRDPGYCYLRAGFKYIGFTKINRLHVLQIKPEDFPSPLRPAGTLQLSF